MLQNNELWCSYIIKLAFLYDLKRATGFKCVLMWFEVFKSV